MPPLAPHGEKSRSGGRQRQEVVGRRSASFHGRGAEQRHQLPKQRPKTQPDLLTGVRGRNFLSADREPPEPAARRTPSKVLVSVAVQRSLWPLHVMASAEWSVADLVAAAVGLYVKEGRRPLLPSIDPSAFGLHYSQFSLESTFLASAILHHTILGSSLENASLRVLACLVACLVLPSLSQLSNLAPRFVLVPLSRLWRDAALLGRKKRRGFAGGLDPRERVMELGSRSFFLCPKSSGTGHAASSSCTSEGASRVRDREAPTKAADAPAWLCYMQFWPMM